MSDITISWALNGAIVKFKGLADEGTDEIVSSMVYKFEDGDLKGLQDLLNDIVDKVYAGCKYDKERVMVKIEHGSDYECKDKDCKICHPD